MPSPHVLGVKNQKDPFLFLFLTMTTPSFFEYARDLAQYMKARMQSSRRPTDPQSMALTWLLGPGPKVQVEKAINLLEEAWSHSRKSDP